ncbi:MAG: translation initiation factor IF-3 [Candidatus Nealsonbacteria bacterium CG_4_10_14_0_2_um_filter_38_17]|uniref:Translation initiation factor IF-3 n=2 Tax=Candidatus Nealsoniibacteriota TaxID=1817911 RepID=A0A2M7UYK3_9BACT|nr:MAG: translation initiation factor IF-3 [Candidatus Nealsonbacteria bacterium CG23_combo_of_CG06-09_8_20_14_all_38_19]PIZ88945.1 MAG: translation initiation factor IF-3 [Candidatus Nealsonbacteria bacterium CG_4_10_14_0_2_um_filter_38_17]
MALYEGGQIIKSILKRPLVNNQIRAPQVRLIDETGKQLGVLPLSEAFDLAEKRELDIIQVTEKLDPPVCKLMDYGKYLYWQEKKQKEAIKHASAGELKGIRLSFGISQYDLETRVRQAEAFLKKGDKVKIEMVLRGREKALGNFAKEKIIKFLEILNGLLPIKTERELKREMRGFTMIISKK